MKNGKKRDVTIWLCGVVTCLCAMLTMASAGGRHSFPGGIWTDGDLITESEDSALVEMATNGNTFALFPMISGNATSALPAFVWNSSSPARPRAEVLADLKRHQQKWNNANNIWKATHHAPDHSLPGVNRRLDEVENVLMAAGLLVD